MKNIKRLIFNTTIMKKILLTFVALLSMTMAMAQSNNSYGQKGPRQMTPEEMTDLMAGKLGLNDAQKTKVAALNKEYKDLFQRPAFGKRPRKMDGTGMNGLPQMTDEMKAKIKEHMAKRQEYESQLKSILSDSQYQTYLNMMFRHGHGGPFGHNHPSPDNQ